jgi:hypothetical protein
LYNVTKGKTVTSREFQHNFSDMASALKPGESITVTKHGEPLGTFTRMPKPRPAPDYLGNLEHIGYSAQAGQKVIDSIWDLS